MDEIMKTLEQYVPHKEITDYYHDLLSGEVISIPKRQVYRTLLGGDQVTAARARGAQRDCCNANSTSEHLLGFYPTIEDWHLKMCLLTVSQITLYMNDML